jgi:hypothetical protein
LAAVVDTKPEPRYIGVSLRLMGDNNKIEQPKVEKETAWKCDTCNKAFNDWYTLNYHKLLEHSKSRRPPIGIR